MAKHIEQKVKMVEKPKDAENVQEFGKITKSNKKNSLVCVPVYHQGIIFRII